MFIGMPYVFSFQFEIKIPFVSCSLLSKKIRKIFAKNFGHPEGRGRTTPILWKKLKLSILTKSCTIESLTVNQ